MKTKISYYTPEDIVGISEARTVEDLTRIALVVLSRMPKPVYWVAGPITSGQRTARENRKRLRDTILCLKIKGITTLNYLPLQKQATKILRREFEDVKLQEKLRDKLYAPIFRSGKIDGLCVMPQSEKSLNVQWMRGFVHASGISVKFIPEKLVPKQTFR